MRLVLQKPVIASIHAEATELTVAFVPPAPLQSITVKNYQYSTDAGITWRDLLPPSSISPITIAGLQEATAYGIQLRAVGSNNLLGEVSEVVYSSTLAS